MFKKRLLLMTLIALFLIPQGGERQSARAQPDEITGGVAPFTGELTADSRDIFDLYGRKAGDEIYVSVEALSPDLHVMVSLNTFSGEERLIAADNFHLNTAAQFGFTLPEEGDYFIYVETLEDTVGDYRLVIGLNTPGVLRGLKNPVNPEFAVRYIPPTPEALPPLEACEDTDVVQFEAGENSRVQVFSEVGGSQVFYDLVELQAGETLYINLKMESEFDLVIGEFIEGGVDVMREYSCGQEALVAYPVPEDGNYTVEIYPYDAPMPYRLLVSMNSSTILRDDTPAEQGEEFATLYIDESQQDNSLSGAVQEVTLSPGTDLCVMQVYNLVRMPANSAIYVYVEALSPGLDPIVKLARGRGSIVLDSDILDEDDDSGAGTDASLVYRLPEEGNYRIAVENAACFSAHYEQVEFRLLIGLDNPNILTGQAEPTGDTLLFTGQNERERTPSLIQEVDGYLEADSVHYYYFYYDLERGDEVYAYITGETGNTTPVVDLLRRADAVPHGDPHCFEFQGLWVSSSFNVNGRESTLYEPVTEYTAYCLRVHDLNKEGFGNYRLTVGVNRPDVYDGDPGEGAAFLKLNPHQSSTNEARIQEFNGEISDGDYDTLTLLSIGAGDTLYMHIEADGFSPSIEMFLPPHVLHPTIEPYIYNSNPYRTTIALEYPFYTDLHSSVIDIFTFDGGGTYRLLAGVNTPEVLRGRGEPTGDAVFVENLPPTVIDIGLKIVQITGVDQKSENFSIVAVLQAEWHDVTLAFHPAENNGVPERRYTNQQLSAFFFENPDQIVWPQFVLENQQGDRSPQTQSLVIHSDGTVLYEERFTATLQAPEFNFRAFPFDTQTFHVRVQTAFISSRYILNDASDDPRFDTGLGDTLGEEEWNFNEYTVTVEEIDNFSQYRMTMVVGRHINFYLYRILVPLFLIVAMGWSILFIENYESRVAAASGNLLIYIAFNFTIGDDLPRLGYLTFLDLLLMVAFLITTFLFALEVYLYRLDSQGKTEKAHRIEKPLIWLYPLVYFVVVGVLVLLYLV